MRVGVIARGESRGLGYQTWDVARHLPAHGVDVSVLLVDPGELGRGHPIHADRFPGALRVGWDGHRFDDVDAVRAWVESVDVIYTAETAYDWRVCAWAREAGVGLVVHTNPELHRPPEGRDGHEPTEWWNPTEYRLHRLPSSTRVVPLPLAAAPAVAARSDGDPIRVLVVGGWKALHDRNGSKLANQAAGILADRADVEWVVGTQGPTVRGWPVPAEWRRDVDDRWALYRDCDVLLMLRRYGGLCLPVHEALASGMAVVMTDVEPNRRWPIIPVEVRARGAAIVAGGRIDICSASARHAAARVRALAEDRRWLADAQRQAREWAAANSWEALGPEWVRRLAHAADRESTRRG